MQKYEILISPKAERDIDGIYEYIAFELFEVQSAEKLAALLEESVLSLEIMPNRGSIRKVGAYANKGYRQIFVKNFVVIYRVNESKNQVSIITIRYAKSNF